MKKLNMKDLYPDFLMSIKAASITLDVYCFEFAYIVPYFVELASISFTTGNDWNDTSLFLFRCQYLLANSSISDLG